jgi:hypothetical protein
MNQKTIKKKLSLNKQTVVNLNNKEKRSARGGKRTTGLLTCEEYSCIPNATGCAPCPPTDCAFPSEDVYTCGSCLDTFCVSLNPPCPVE